MSEENNMNFRNFFLLIVSIAALLSVGCSSLPVKDGLGIAGGFAGRMMGLDVKETAFLAGSLAAIGGVVDETGNAIKQSNSWSRLERNNVISVTTDRESGFHYIRLVRDDFFVNEHRVPDYVARDLVAFCQTLRRDVHTVYLHGVYAPKQRENQDIAIARASEVASYLKQDYCGLNVEIVESVAGSIAEDSPRVWMAIAPDGLLAKAGRAVNPTKGTTFGDLGNAKRPYGIPTFASRR